MGGIVYGLHFTDITWIAWNIKNMEKEKHAWCLKKEDSEAVNGDDEQWVYNVYRDWKRNDKDFEW